MYQLGWLSCADCDRMFPSREERDDHCSGSGHWYKCDRCPLAFQTKEKCWAHMVNMDHFMYECQYCDQTSPTEARLVTHEQSHFNYLCELCAHIFLTNGDLLEHCREMHHLCTNCPARFRKQAELDQHRMDYHYYCKDCDQTFPSEASLKAHKLTLSCGLCGERFSTAAEKLQHLHSNHHVCTTCRLAHLHQADFDQHQVDQHFFCKDCDRYFNNRNSIKQHLHSKVHLGQNMACPFCHNHFTTATGVAHHLETGSCQKAPQVNRDRLYELVRAKDPQGIISKKLVGWTGSSPTYEATSRTWNGRQFECYLCHRGFGSLQGLNQHLNSPVHKRLST